MPRVKIAPAPQDRETLAVEIARLRDLDLAALRARWRTVFRRQAPPHLPRHLLFRTLAYRLQADHLGDPIPFTRGSLAHLLRNRFYIGEVVYKGETLAGEQPAIIERDLFEAVQAQAQRADAPTQATADPIRGASCRAPL